MKVLTANRLTDGEAVWFHSEQHWSDTLAGADIAFDKTGEERLEAVGKAAFKENFALDIELVDIQLVDGQIVPVRLRERIRAAGPTNRLDLGKQARNPEA
jgi:hypothetical protein